MLKENNQLSSEKVKDSEVLQKPILWGGYELKDGLTVKTRVAYELFTDVYKLSDETFLYLFTKVKLNDVKNRASDITVVDVSGKQYIAHYDKRYSKRYLSQIIEGFSQTRGFDAVAGMSDLKALFKKDVIVPLQNPEKYQKFNLSVPNGILLYGPPGCGKTFIARKLAEEISYNFVELKHSDIGGSYIHETAQNIKQTFEAARAQAPSVVFIDEMEAMVPKRSELGASEKYRQEEINEFLMQLNDAGKQNVFVIGATNHPELMDTAITRAGRLDKKFYVSPPDKEARIDLFKMYLGERPLKDVDYDWLADLTQDFASVDIEYICEESARNAVEYDLDAITQDVLMDIIYKTKSSIAPEEILKFQKEQV